MFYTFNHQVLSHIIASIKHLNLCFSSLCKFVLHFDLHMLFQIIYYRNNVNVKGYFSWSLMDNFEWSAGFTNRFGNIFIDFKDNLKRHPKFSAYWFKFILRKISTSSGGLISPNVGLTHHLLAIENGTVEEEEKKDPGSEVNSDPPLGSVEEGKKDPGSEVNSDPPLGSVVDPISSAQNQMSMCYRKMRPWAFQFVCETIKLRVVLIA